MKKINSKIINISVFLIALNVVLSRIITTHNVINYDEFPIIFAGVVYGPIVGGVVGAIGDIVSFIVRPTGLFIPHFVLTSTLTGIIPGLLMRLLKAELSNFPLW